MEGILPQHRASINYVVGQLRERKTPIGVGYNDMAIMLAHGQSELGIPIVNSAMISSFLAKHPAVPEDARMESDRVQNYLQVLEEAHLIDALENPGDYRMRGDTSEILVADTGRLKSPHIDDFLFHGFRIHAGWTLG